jgi:hypothetical protein
MKQLVLIAIILFQTCLGPKRDKVSCEISGKIQNMDEMPLVGVPICFIAGSDSLRLSKSDKKGKYSFKGLVPSDEEGYLFVEAYDKVAPDGNKYLNAMTGSIVNAVHGPLPGLTEYKFNYDFKLLCYTCGEIKIPTLIFSMCTLWFDEFSDSRDSLMFVHSLLKENPKLKVELGCHTDARGSEKANLVLSQRRVESAVNYLIETGVDPNRITAMGYGESKPIIPDSVIQRAQTEEEREQYHQTNRRCSLLAIE